MKVHDEIESLTDVYLAGGLEAGERAQVEEHAASCAACASVLRDAKEFHGWVSGSSARTAPPGDLEDRIIANLRVSTHRRSPKVIRLLVGVAAVLLIVIVGAMFTTSDASTGLVQRMTFMHKNPQTQFAAVDPSLPPESGDSAGYLGGMQEGGTSKSEGVDTFAVGVGTLADQLKYQAQRKGLSFADAKGAALRSRAEGKNAELNDKSVRDSMGVGGGSGGGGRYGGRHGGRLAEAEKKPAATPVPDAATSRGVEESDHNESEGGETLKDQGQRPGEPQDPAAANRKIIRNADLHLEVEKYDEAYAKIGEITRAKKGFVAGASTTRLANGKIRATITLRIPPERFEETLAELGKLGSVRHQAISTADVTKQYSDLESRLKSKETLVERLKKVLMEGKGTVKELMEVEVQMGATIEQIESIKGELKYYDNLVGLSTITMQVFEKDLGLPFEYVQTLQSVITVTARDADLAYDGAQKVILDAGGQVVESRMTRANEDSASGYVRGKVDADKFPAVRDALKKLGQQVDQDTVNQQQTGRGGQGDAKPGAPVKKEQAVIDFTVNTPPLVVTKQAKIGLVAKKAEEAYLAARREIEAAGGEIVGGSLTDRIDGARAFVRGQVDADKFPAVVEKLKTLGIVKHATVEQIVQGGAESAKPPLLRERGEIILEIATPPPLLTEDQGIGKVIRDTFSKSLAGILWSIEKLFVGIALAGPWILLALVVLLIWRKVRRRKATA